MPGLFDSLFSVRTSTPPSNTRAHLFRFFRARMGVRSALWWSLLFSLIVYFAISIFTSVADPLPTDLRLHRRSAPVLSIVIPIFNSASTLEMAIMSCVTQRYMEYELVCVFDGSTDESESILRFLVQRWDIQVQIVRHETSQGLLLARKAGLMAARGRYIMSLDPDDVFLGNIFESVARAHEETGADMVLFQMMLSVDGARPKLWLYRVPPKDVLGNQEIRKAVIRGRVMHNRVLLSIERELNMKAFDILSVRFRSFLFQEEDRLQTYIAFYFARKLVYLREPGYLYFRVIKKHGTARWNGLLRQVWDVRTFLKTIYGVDKMNW
jgi:glycosyltransferase involved in cell wall biosynthesis